MVAASSSAFPPEPVQPPPPPCLPPSGHVRPVRPVSCTCRPSPSLAPKLRVRPGVFQPPSLRAANPLSFPPSMKSTESHFTFICWVRLERRTQLWEKRNRWQNSGWSWECFFARCYFASLLKGSSVCIHHSEVPRFALISVQAFNFLVVGRDSRFACSHLTMKRRRL